jgi:RNA polymerase sigma-70 factor, ECF subfamily
MESATEILGYLPAHWKDHLIGMSPAPRKDPLQAVEPPQQSAATTAPPVRLDECPELTGRDEEVMGEGEESWTRLVNRLQDGDPAAMAELYQVFAKGIRFYLCRQVGTQELDDRVHDAFLVVVQSIQRGELRDPRRLMGFVRTVVRRMVAAQIDRDIQNRKETLDLDFGERVADQRANPEKSVMLRQKIDLIRQVLDQMSDKDREILFRFYVEEQHPERICDEMKLSITQFRLLKNRAKSRFGELGKKKLLGSIIYEDSVRTFE